MIIKLTGAEIREVGDPGRSRAKPAVITTLWDNTIMVIISFARSFREVYARGRVLRFGLL
ncbi:hypothetical protein RSAG8_02462, partial [Rhizoctonia solani AG-8 WAC10335]